MYKTGSSPRNINMKSSNIQSPFSQHLTWYGADCNSVGMRPIGWERPNTQAQTHSGSKQKYYIIQDNRQICTPVYPTPRAQDNQPNECDIYNK